VYYGDQRDSYDVRGRVVHESIFNTNDGNYRCPSTQQGYSPFTTWTRGLAWIVLGYAEELEALAEFQDEELADFGGRKAVNKLLLNAVQAAADFFIENTPTDGVPYWDTGAPGLAKMPDHLKKPSQPDNPYEPVDSSAAAITAQGLLRLGRFLGENKAGKKYWQAGLTVARTLFKAPYMSEDPKHHGLLLHSVYHRPNSWDYVPPGKKVPLGESCMWGDYHFMELALYLQRIIDGEAYYTFFDRE
jgi:unsaturated chondroitin disaccharide hydrolase